MLYHKHRCVNCVNCVNRFVLSLARRLPSPLSSSQSEAAARPLVACHRRDARKPSLRRATRNISCLYMWNEHPKRVKNRKNILKTGDFSLFFMKTSVYCEESTIAPAPPTKSPYKANYHSCKQLTQLAGDFVLHYLRNLRTFFYPLWFFLN